MKKDTKPARFSSPVTVEFLKQGGTWTLGTVVGRKGSQLRIAYRITDGQNRERWFPRARYRAIQGDLETVQRYKNARCNGGQLSEAIEIAPENLQALLALPGAEATPAWTYNRKMGIREESEEMTVNLCAGFPCDLCGDPHEWLFEYTWRNDPEGPGLLPVVTVTGWASIKLEDVKAEG